MQSTNYTAVVVLEMEFIPLQRGARLLWPTDAKIMICASLSPEGISKTYSAFGLKSVIKYEYAFPSHRNILHEND